MAKSIILCVLFFGLSAVSVSAQSLTVAQRKAQALCQRVSKIKTLPHAPGERGVDANYDKLVAAGEAIIPCLIDKITDTTITHDPRCPTISGATKIGDVAYFVLVDITKIGFAELLPEDVREKYKTTGAYAYHDYIEQKGKRIELQTKLREWYRKKRNA